MDAPLSNNGLLNLPVRFGLEASVRVGGAGIGVVDEHDSMADEHIVFNRHALADERVAGDLAALADAAFF